MNVYIVICVPGYNKKREFIPYSDRIPSFPRNKNWVIAGSMERKYILSTMYAFKMGCTCFWKGL